MTTVLLGVGLLAGFLCIVLLSVGILHSFLYMEDAVQEDTKTKEKPKYIVDTSAYPCCQIQFVLPGEQEDTEVEIVVEEDPDPDIGRDNPAFKKYGWPTGMENAKLRFIRLDHGGPNWDRNMGRDADYNMLMKLRDFTGFAVAECTESIKPDQFARFLKGSGYPFIYITGTGAIYLSEEDVKILRKYLLVKNGMIFADNCGGDFDFHFRALMRQVLPDLRFVNISNDDVIFQYPFLFLTGAPPLFRHSGDRAQGIKYNGRWVVFYHPGAMGDVWRTEGFGLSPEVQMMAYKMGANVIAYAFTQYFAQNQERMKN